MPIYNGSDKIIGLYFDGRYHTAAYLGKTLVWKKSEPPALLDWLCFTAQEANSTIEMAVNGTLTKNQAFETSTDGVVWTEFVPGTTVITLANVGDKVFFRGDNETFSESVKNYYKFVMAGKISASGNVMSLLSKTIGVNEVPSFCFFAAFADCVSLTGFSYLVATTVQEEGYGEMFSGCSGLIVGPEMTMNNAGANCCRMMFKDCSSLTKTTSVLPAMALSGVCYSNMYDGCVALTRAPELPAVDGPDSAYRRMFNGCTSLHYIKMGYTGDFASKFTDWVAGVSATGDFYYNGTDTTRGDSAIPVGWTVHTF